MRVTKEALGNGTYHIVTSACCHTVFGCTPYAYHDFEGKALYEVRRGNLDTNPQSRR